MIINATWIVVASLVGQGQGLFGHHCNVACEAPLKQHVVESHGARGLPSFKNEALSKQAYDHALEFARRGDFRKAFASLTAAIRFDPDYALAYASRAHVRSMLGDQLGGIGDADYAIGLDPTLALGYFNRGVIYGRMRLWASAADDYATAGFLDPDLGGGIVFNNLGSALMAQGKYSEAIANFSRAIGRVSVPAISYFNRSLAYERSGQLDAAISDMNATIQSVPKFAEAHHRRALLFLKKGVDGQALYDLDNALKLDPDDSIARADRALLHERLGNAADAKDDFMRFSEQSNEDPRKIDRERHTRHFLRH